MLYIISHLRLQDKALTTNLMTKFSTILGKSASVAY